MKNLIRKIAGITCLSGALIIGSCNKNPTFQRNEYYMLGDFDKWTEAIKLEIEGNYGNKSSKETRRKHLEFQKVMTNEEAKRHFQNFGDKVYFCDDNLP